MDRLEGSEMATFLNAEQEGLAQEIAGLLIRREETVSVAEATAGGLVSAALLWVPGASRYYAGGGVVYTLNSRTVLAGIEPIDPATYQGTTAEMVADMAESMRRRLGSTWCIAESGLAGPTPGRSGAPPGRVNIAVAGPVPRKETINTGIADREENMVLFTTMSLRMLRDAIRSA
jgi:PncC family amidohydrolase